LLFFPIHSPCVSVGPESDCLGATQVHTIAVKSGPKGYEQFMEQVRTFFGIDDNWEVNVNFDCAEPVTGECDRQTGMIGG
jgi:hypothetical protein